MKRSNPAEKLAKKKQTWISRTASILGISEVQAKDLLTIERRQSLRLNPLVAYDRPLDELMQAGWQGQQYAWMADGYTIDQGATAIRDSQAVNAGAVFIQNAASWLPVLALDPQPGEIILDVCAAPGGKTSHIAAITGNKARITANDNSRPRLAKLQANLTRLGARIERYTLFDATSLARKLEGQHFDRILIDAPCSGEGLMRLDRDKDFASWSVAHIKRLQQLQKRIITQAWQLLAPGGTLVYSTCTLAPEENEAVIDYLLRSQDDAHTVALDMSLPNRVPAVLSWNDRLFSPALADCLRLQPSPTIEAFFVCKLRKDKET